MSLVENGELLEWAVVHGQNRYGTLRSTVDAAIAEGRSVLLEIDLQGARQVKQAVPGRPVRVPGAAELGRNGPPAGGPRHGKRRGTAAEAGNR